MNRKLMNRRILVGISIAAVSMAALAGCSQTGGASGYGSPGGTPSSTSQPTTAAQGALGTASSSLGTIAVDGKGMTVYVFDKDTPNSGKSACTDKCAATWPAVIAASAAPEAKGITGKVGTMPRADGSMQVTLNGLPLYTYSGDSAAGDVNGQGLGSVWWVVSPAGAKISGSRGGY